MDLGITAPILSPLPATDFCCPPSLWKCSCFSLSYYQILLYHISVSLQGLNLRGWMYIPILFISPTSRFSPSSAAHSSHDAPLPRGPTSLFEKSWRRDATSTNNATIAVVVGVLLGLFVLVTAAFLYRYRYTVRFRRRRRRRHRRAHGSKSSKTSSEGASHQQPPPVSAPAADPPAEG